MRLLLAIALLLLFLWLHKAHTSSDSWYGQQCESVSSSKAVVSLLLSPLTLYSWLTTTLLRLFLAVPPLVLGAIFNSLLLLMAWPWCIASVCISVLLKCLHVALYLLHLALVVCVVAILTLEQHKMADRAATADQNALYQQKKPESRHNITRLRMFGRRIAQHQSSHLIIKNLRNTGQLWTNRIISKEEGRGTC
ncbi:hypothetical protein JOB18_000057 [Solea senegalensis]|uniref:Uncharacterized protein n=1 Tax=Solea senegalensis TaxID=28829 RepID=A0AAV6Q7W7_SOLSE|nr:hypothetical protein JOB18_000057 [Solea senegalensis]